MSVDLSETLGAMANMVNHGDIGEIGPDHDHQVLHEGAVIVQVNDGIDPMQTKAK